MLVCFRVYSCLVRSALQRLMCFCSSLRQKQTQQNSYKLPLVARPTDVPRGRRFMCELGVRPCGYFGKFWSSTRFLTWKLLLLLLVFLLGCTITPVIVASLIVAFIFVLWCLQSCCVFNTCVFAFTFVYFSLLWCCSIYINFLVFAYVLGHLHSCCGVYIHVVTFTFVSLCLHTCHHLCNGVVTLTLMLWRVHSCHGVYICVVAFLLLACFCVVYLHHFCGVFSHVVSFLKCLIPPSCCTYMHFAELFRNVWKLCNHVCIIMT